MIYESIAVPKHLNAEAASKLLPWIVQTDRNSVSVSAPKTTI